MKLYQYAVIYIPKKKEKEGEKEPKLLVPITSVLASDDAQATILASRAIPEEYLGELDQIQLAVRPF